MTGPAAFLLYALFVGIGLSAVPTLPHGGLVAVGALLGFLLIDKILNMRQEQDANARAGRSRGR